MPAAVIPFQALVQAEFLILSVHPPGETPFPLGVFLYDSQTGDFDLRMLEDVNELPLGPDDREYVSYLEEDFRVRLKEMGGVEFLSMVESSFSGFLRLSEREAVSGRSFEKMLTSVFFKHVDTQIRPYRSHLPVFGLQAAATKFGEDSEVSEADVEWVRAPEGLRVTEDLFVVQVVGRSMEPLIPDGSLAVFRRIRAGSRFGKRLLIEELGVTGQSGRYTVKRYTSSKKRFNEDEWEHHTIRLEPLNPEFPAFELDAESFEGKYRVIGEFIQVLPALD